VIVDPNVIRAPLYKYSENAVKAMINSAPEIAFLIAWFCLNPAAKDYVL
jgi:hypothetical protein